MKNRRMSTAITATILLVNFGCIILLYLVANLTMTTIMRKSAMDNLHASLKMQSEIIEEYIRHQEDLLDAFSGSARVVELLNDQDNPQKRAIAQTATELYYNRLDNWEGLYIADWSTHVLTHSNPATIGLVTRPDEKERRQLQMAMMTRNGLYNASMLISPASGERIISLYCPVYDEHGGVIGFVGGGPYAEELDDYMASAKDDAITYYMINAETGKYIFAEEKELMATDIEDEMLLSVISTIKQDETVLLGDSEYEDDEEGASVLTYRYMPKYGWALVACDSEANIYADVTKNMTVLAVICLVFELLIGVFSWLSISFGMRPLKHIRNAILRLRELELTKSPELWQYIGTSSEVGEIATAIDSLYDSIGDMLKAEREKQAVIAASESKARFLASMSHEIRTPLNTVIGMNEMILRESKDGIIQEYARNIKREGQLLIGLVNDVLDFSKIEAGKLVIMERAYQPYHMLYETILSMMPHVREKQLELVRDFDSSIPKWLIGDEIRVRQILNNLLSNAIKYTEEGQISLRVRGFLSEDGYRLEFSVQDTGIGIREENLERIFESFQRIEPNRKYYIEGTGLGLNITKQLVDNMGGTISVVSEYGKGSCFTVVLPQRTADGANAELVTAGAGTDTVTQSLLLSDKRILAVDDNKMNLTVLRGLLKRSKVNVDTANGGAEGLAMTKQTKYDLILMDHMMPEPDGIEILHRVREDGENPNRNTAMVVLTANAIAGMEKEYLSEGFAGYLTKPISVERLESMLRHFLIDVDGAEKTADSFFRETTE